MTTAFAELARLTGIEYHHLELRREAGEPIPKAALRSARKSRRFLKRTHLILVDAEPDPGVPPDPDRDPRDLFTDDYLKDE